MAGGAWLRFGSSDFMDTDSFWATELGMLDKCISNILIYSMQPWWSIYEMQKQTNINMRLMMLFK